MKKDHYTKFKEEGNEQIDPPKAVISKDHVLLYNHGKINNVEVPEFKRKVDSWDSVTKLVSKFTEEMSLLIAKLMYKEDPYMVDKLNKILDVNNLMKEDHVLYAIYRFGNKYRSKEEKEETDMALKKCFMEVGGINEVPMIAIRDQWPTCWRWTKARLTFSHLRLQLEFNDLEELKSQIKIKEEYEEVLEGKIHGIMIDLVTKMKTSTTFM